MLGEIIHNAAKAELALKSILLSIHENGPIDPEQFEILSYIKDFHSDLFKKYEGELIFLLGLFFKTDEPTTLLEAVYNTYAQSIFEKTGRKFTPVQANIYDEILDKKYFSFSAPTSTGKSYILRELINDFQKDIVVVVPSRALIAEYMAVILRTLNNDKSVLVMQFVENINIAKTKRRIFVITPERGGDLFRVIDQLNIGLFIFDEAQISEEPIRGMTFDAFVRRVDKLIPTATKVFTHPFISNPEAQLEKHKFDNQSSARAYEQHSVGKIFVSVRGRKFKYFSPYAEKISTVVNVPHDLVRNLLESGKSLLIFVSKSQIYKHEHISEFSDYIDICPIVRSVSAKNIISELRDYIGASRSEERHSIMIDLMERGIVIHHGSIPLKGRLLIEQFVNEGHAKVCFATSTLIQGINMPFDAVWIDNFRFHGTEDDKVLGMKNLIGRAGRTSGRHNSFDYGYVIVNESNRKVFSERIRDSVVLSNSSALDKDLSDIPDDQKDIAEAIQTDTFDSDLNLTEIQIERIKNKNLSAEIKFILDRFIIDSRLITASEYRDLPETERNKIKTNFQEIYLSHLRKQTLSRREKVILSTAITIMLWRVQGKSFKEIVSLRHAYLSRKSEQRAITARVKKKEITEEQALQEKRELKIVYSQQADRIPSSDHGTFGLFGTNESVMSIDYDKLVFDTYDYLDKVIAQCLVDPITGALSLYFDVSGDARALMLKNYIRYGVNDLKEIWLLRYGFEPEDIEWIKELVSSVDERQINFNSGIDDLDGNKRVVIERFV